ncbi:MAG TPA: YceI family protein [Chthoniobacterales bacterium]|jgi:polyisoprenoid-binding protein YceI|nr:YceI family protein [Chthoniobacterales bacterium]
MKRILFLASISAFVLAQSAFTADTYVFDKPHCTMGFQVRHLFSKVPGKFDDFEGKIQFDEANPENSSVEVKIKTASVDTGFAVRDNNLRSPDFFDVEKFPEITFKSKSVKRTGETTGEVTGDLNMHGVTKEVVLNVELLGKGAGPKGTTLSGWEAKTDLKRSEFGLTWNQMVEGTQVVGEDVEIDLHVQADKQ